MDELVLAACSAGLVILCESEYLCWKLFKRKMSVGVSISDSIKCYVNCIERLKFFHILSGQIADVCCYPRSAICNGCELSYDDIASIKNHMQYTSDHNVCAYHARNFMDNIEIFSDTMEVN